MAVLLQVDFTVPAELVGDNLAQSAIELAQSITQEPGFIAKIWTENKDALEAGGIYLFQDSSTAQAYITMHQKHLEGMGISHVRCKLFEINETLTQITCGPLHWD